MKNSLTSLLGKHALWEAKSADYVDWAGELLVDGFDSPSLRILAGLDRSAFSSSTEAEAYFFRTVEELGLETPDPDVAIRSYASEVAEKIIDRELSATDGIRIMKGICQGTDYHPDFVVWLELDEALSCVTDGTYPYTYESLTLENLDETVVQEATEFIKDRRPKP